MSKLIICPFCGAHYLPDEVFYPEDFIGEHYDVSKDEEGHIEHCLGYDGKVEEEYTCDHCGHTFKVVAELSFVTEPSKNHDFGSDHVEEICSNRVVLSED